MFFYFSPLLRFHGRQLGILTLSIVFLSTDATRGGKPLLRCVSFHTDATPVDLSNRGNQDPFPKMNGLRWFLVIVFSWKTAVTQ